MLVMYQANAGTLNLNFLTAILQFQLAFCCLYIPVLVRNSARGQALFPTTLLKLKNPLLLHLFVLLLSSLLLEDSSTLPRSFLRCCWASPSFFCYPTCQSLICELISHHTLLALTV